MAFVLLAIGTGSARAEPLPAGTAAPRPGQIRLRLSAPGDAGVERLPSYLPTFAKAPESGVRAQLLRVPGAAVVLRGLHAHQVPVVRADSRSQQTEAENAAERSA